MQAKDKYRVQDNIGYCSDQHGKHSDPRLALADNECVQSKRQLHEKRANQINRQIIHGISYSSIAGSKHIEQGSLERIEKGHQRHCTDNQEADTVAQDLLRMFPVSLSKPDSRKRCGAVADKSRKGRDEHSDAEGYSYPCQRIGAHAFHMSDINTVDNAV